MGAIIMLGFLIKGAIGFGEGSFSMPLLVLFLDIKFVLPVFLVIELIGDFYLIYLFKKDIAKKVIYIILTASVIGVILGTYLLDVLDSQLIKIVFAVYVIIFAVKTLFFDKVKAGKKKAEKPLGMAAGFAGGFIDALFGTGGAPIVMYLSYINLKKAVFRATCVVSFFIFHFSRLITYSFSGLLNMETLKIGLYLVPAIVIGSVIGMKLHNKVNGIVFRKLVAVVLLIVGIILLI